MQNLLSNWNAASPEQLFAKASQHLPIWVSLTLTVLIAYHLARVTWMLYPTGDTMQWTPPPPPNGAVSTRGGTNTRDYTAITNTHLFGSATESAVAVVVETEDAPDTRLNLKLRAAVAADDEQVAHAIIADGSGDEKVYFIKGAIPGGATLHRVHIDRVILNRGGVLETLRLPRGAEESSATKRTRTASSRRAPRSTNAQKLISQNAATFSEVIRPQPFMPNGQLKGYRVFPGRNRQQFIALGLRPGDLVTAINGVALNNPAQGMEIFRSLGSSSQVSVTLERGGQQQTLNLDVNQLSGAGGNKR